MSIRPPVSSGSSVVVTASTYGAVGNGVANDAAAIQAALTAASSGGVVLFPPGDYLVSGAVLTVASDDVTLYGPGARLVRPRLSITGARVKVIGLELDGDSFNNTAAGIVIAAADAVVEDCYIHGIHTNAVEFSGNPARPTIRNCRIDDIGGAGITVTSQGCAVYGQATDERVESNHITRTRGHAAVFLADVAGAHVIDNTIENTFYRGVQVFGTPSRVVIENNRIRDCGGINTGASGVGCNGIFSGSTGAAHHVIIRGNHVSNVAENGIEAYSAVVEGNVVEDTGSYPGLATTSTEGIYLHSGLAKGNYVKSTPSHGIRAFGDFDDLHVVGNVIVDVTNYGVNVQADGAVTASRITIANNVVVDTAGTGSGITLAATNGATIATSARVTGNVVIGNSSNSVATAAQRWGNSFDSVTGVLASVSDTTGGDASTTSGTFADVDATDLAVTFTVPLSGAVVITVNARVNVDNATAISLNLREGAADVAGTAQFVLYHDAGGSVQVRAATTFRLTGLTPGDSKTYKLGFARSFGAGTAAIKRAADDPVTMLVLAA